MAKPLFQDIVPPDRRSITRVPVPNRTSRRGENIAEPATEPRATRAGSRRLRVPDDEPEGAEILTPSREEPPRKIASRQSTPPPPMRRVPFYEERDPYRRRFPWKASVVFVCALAMIAGTYIVLSQYAKATVTITPKTETLTLNNQFIGTPQNATSSISTATAIPFTVISITKDGAMSVVSTGQTTTQTKATGQIIVFNAYSSSPQKLIVGTRFSTPSGLIYRTTSAITVPGKTEKAPGSITATIIADKPGNQYNIGLSDFAIPGLSGTPAYTGMYARSKTAMAGGFSGIQPQVDPGTLAAAQATIDAELEGSLLQEAGQQVPPGDVLLPNAYIVNYTHQPTTAASSSEAVVSEEGTIRAFAFDSTKLAQAFAGTEASSSAGIIWKLDTISGLDFAITTATSTSSGMFWTTPSMPFKINGTVNLVAATDIQKIQENLAGKPKNDFIPTLNSFPGIINATLSIEPFWQQSFPTSPKNISITIPQ